MKTPQSPKTFHLATNGIALGIISVALVSSLHAQSTWTGATDSNYDTATNWSTGTVPGPADDVVIDTNTPNAPVRSGNLERGGVGTTTISGTGDLTVNGRFLNGGSGAFNMLGGSLTVNGQYFLVGRDVTDGSTNGPGTFNQSAGTVLANLSRGWQLSDNSLAASGSVYNLNGGTLTVIQSADSGVGEDLRGVWLGKGGGGAGTMAGDHFNVAGGVAEFTHTGSNESNIRISRNSELSVTSGSVSFADYSNFWIGAGDNGSTTNRILVDGGTLTVSGTTNMYLGREDDGQLTINSGTLSLEGFLFLGGDGSGGLDGVGTVTMTGGELIAGSIEQLGAGSIFNFSGGTITLDGDQTDIVNQSWFSGEAVAVYDSLNDVTTISAVPEPATVALMAMGGIGLIALRRRRCRLR